MTSPTAFDLAGPKLAIGVTAVAAGLVTLALTFLGLSWDASLPDSWGFRGYQIIHAIGFTAAGAVVAIRRSANAIGWLLLGAGLMAALGAFGLEYGVYAIVGRTAPLPGAALAAWLGSWTWVLYVTGALTFVLLLFPTGRLLSARWWPAGVIAIGSIAVTAAYMALRPGPLQAAAYLDNPVTPLAPSAVDVLGVISIASILPTTGSAAWSLVLRFRRSSGAERQQIKWLAFSSVPLAIAGFASAVLPDKLGQVLFVFLQLSIPAAIGVAVVRYRLYDIDVLIRRTLIYAAVSLTLAATYFAGVVLLQTALRPLIGGSEVPVALSTLAVVGLFAPLRRRIQQVVDRRFYRSRYDAARTLDAFGVRLRDEVDLDSVRADLLDVVHVTVRPAHASLWLRARGR